MSSFKGLVNPTQEKSKSISQQLAKELYENSPNTSKQFDVKFYKKQETKDIKTTSPSKFVLCILS